jgi:hypothetical protein
MGVRTQLSMVDGKDYKAVTYVNSETGFGNLSIVQGVDRLIYIMDTDMKEGHQKPTIEHTIYIQSYQQIPIDLLDLEVKHSRDSHVMSINSASKS